MEKRRILQNKMNLTKKDKDDLKYLYKQTNKSFRKTHRLKILEKWIENTRFAKKAYKKLDRSKKWISALQRGPTICKSRTDIINIASDFYSLYFYKPAFKVLQQTK